MISSDPSGAEVQVDGIVRGRTPVDVEMKRKRNHLVTISKEGFETENIPVVQDLGGAVWGNIVLGGLIGWGVDATSGAQYNLNPPTIFLKLVPLDSASKERYQAGDTEASSLVKELNVLDDLKKREKITKEEYILLRLGLFKRYFPEAEFELGLPQIKWVA